MRARLGGLWALLWFGGCFAPDYEQKQCLGKSGCPDGYACLAGQCAELDRSAAGIAENWFAVQRDMVSLGCASTGCHGSTPGSRLWIDPAPGSESVNFARMVTVGAVLPWWPTCSPLIHVPFRGARMSGGAEGAHVKALPRPMALRWYAWIGNGAPYVDQPIWPPEGWECGR